MILRLLIRAVLAVTPVIVTLFALEGIVRLVAAPQAMVVPWQDDIYGVTAPKPEVQGRFAIPDRFDTTVTVHSRFRSRTPVALEPPAGTTRVAVLGDSATFGWGSEDGETFPAVLGQLLNGAGLSGRKVEVVNAGVIGTGTGEQALWYDLWVKNFQPSIVVLTVSWNDVIDDVRGAFFEQRGEIVQPRSLDVLERGLDPVRRTRAMANRVPGFGWLSQHSQLLGWIRQAPTGWFAAQHARAVGGSAVVERGEPLKPEELALFRGELRWLRARITPPARLAVVFLPAAEQYDSSRPGAPLTVARSEQTASTLETVSALTSTPFLDLRPVLGRNTDPARLYFASDPHPNPAGNRAIAEALAGFLEQLLPD